MAGELATDKAITTVEASKALFRLDSRPGLFIEKL
jgi:hypothetical protein